MPCFTKLDTYDPETGNLNLIIETPQGSRNKYKYDPDHRIFRVHGLLPVGSVFPYAFGFIPSTLGEDGDPVDVLVIMEEPAPGGFLVPARLIGVIEAEQTEDGKTERNDRLIALSTESHHHKGMNSLNDLGNEILDEIEHFFVSYNLLHGKKFKAIGRYGPGRAQKLVKEGQDRFDKKKSSRKKRKKQEANAAG
ncbi:MAG: inorganic diphosphatase [Gemmataceae bacterium]